MRFYKSSARRFEWAGYRSWTGTACAMFLNPVLNCRTVPGGASQGVCRGARNLPDRELSYFCWR